MQHSKLGSRVCTFRERLGLSPDQLAEKAGLTTAALLDLEAGRMEPALGPLVRIARTLGCRLGTLMDDELTQDPLVVRRADRQTRVVDNAHADAAPSLTFHSLGRGKSDRHMEPFFIELAPCQDSSAPPEPSGHEGEEFIVVRRGQVGLTYGLEETILGPGDCAYYNSVVPHLVRCHGSEPAAIYAVIYVPF